MNGFTVERLCNWMPASSSQSRSRRQAQVWADVLCLSASPSAWLPFCQASLCQVVLHNRQQVALQRSLLAVVTALPQHLDRLDVSVAAEVFESCGLSCWTLGGVPTVLGNLEQAS